MLQYSVIKLTAKLITYANAKMLDYDIILTFCFYISIAIICTSHKWEIAHNK